MIRVISLVLVLMFSISLISCNSNKNSIGGHETQKAKRVEQSSSETPDSHSIDIKTNVLVPTKEVKIKKPN